MYMLFMYVCLFIYIYTYIISLFKLSCLHPKENAELQVSTLQSMRQLVFWSIGIRTLGVNQRNPCSMSIQETGPPGCKSNIRDSDRNIEKQTVLKLLH